LSTFPFIKIYFRTSEDIEELQCEYERYRILILNEFEKVPEHIFLQEIAQKEFWPVDPVSQSVRVEAEKKKQSREKKAAVAFAYEDTQTVGGKPESDESEDDDDEFIEPEEFDLKFDVDALDPERIRSLNKFGMKYGIALGAFSRLLKMDRREQDETHQLKEIEKAKLALAVCNSILIIITF
uniref:DRY_EERY domain-containing protein n=1 Tax=Dracunculus medinensis TaxID=318479 RepID=A0A0N4U179_DRAME